MERAGGRPLFLEELAASLAERTTSSEHELPHSVKAIIAARLDCLPPSARSVLLDAAVLGRIFWRRPLEQLGDDGGLAETLDLLEARDFIRRQPSRVEDDEQFAFRHILTREAAYATLPKAVRRERHATVARLLEAATADRAGRSAALLAHHWREAGDPERAVSYLLTAAEEAEQAWPSARRRRCTRRPWSSSARTASDAAARSAYGGRRRWSTAATCRPPRPSWKRCCPSWMAATWWRRC